ncbi:MULTISPECIES: dTMP kinase [unclassified Crossiella]|uniref:dTMP kinase n=1 Tax=unclassified Crossiella TaxID=2620835 RepID=UPI001FFE51CD|nr:MULTISPECIES: dTMP kinase [unclassified Crossiella]MCK2241897.1 dTMP kinase [Crossiella sp. S99.2]MCK2255800.1 dTMP kinase [Crossiella sp. S99.1]
MSTETLEQPRLPGTLITLDGPGGAGKSTLTRLLTQRLRAAGWPVHATAGPSWAPLGELARHGTDTYHGMALACLCAADRHHQLAVEILPALQEGQIVLCDRYLPSSLVLQGLDGIPTETVWALNRGVYRPDLTLILTADPAVLAARLRQRGTHSRFERAADSSLRESQLYLTAQAELHTAGWPTTTVETATAPPEDAAARIVSLIRPLAKETRAAC